MYLAETINGILDSKKDKLIGRTSYFHVVDILNRAFRKKEPFVFRFELYSDFSKNDFTVSGLYDMDRNERFIVLNFAKDYKHFELKEEMWKEFKFAISQVCQHESIHKLQWQHRETDPSSRMPLEFKFECSSKEEERDYLKDVDEIDAYAHDIAMEIKFFYPRKDPYLVLRRINNHNKIWSYRYYKKTFRGTIWVSIHNRLLKKTYMWLPYVTV